MGHDPPCVMWTHDPERAGGRPTHSSASPGVPFALLLFQWHPFTLFPTACRNPHRLSQKSGSLTSCGAVGHTPSRLSGQATPGMMGLPRQMSTVRPKEQTRNDDWESPRNACELTGPAVSFRLAGVSGGRWMDVSRIADLQCSKERGYETLESDTRHRR